MDGDTRVRAMSEIRSEQLTAKECAPNTRLKKTASTARQAANLVARKPRQDKKVKSEGGLGPSSDFMGARWRHMAPRSEIWAALSPTPLLIHFVWPGSSGLGRRTCFTYGWMLSAWSAATRLLTRPSSILSRAGYVRSLSMPVYSRQLARQPQT